jgi:lipopolysaccharide assembly outer membrane protein LptD (OstA)
MRRRPLLLLFCVVAIVAAGAATAEKWSIRTFSDKEGYLTGIFRGAQATPGPNDTLSIVDLYAQTYAGGEKPQFETALIAPLANFDPKRNRASGDKSVRIIRDDFEATATRWTYDHKEKRVTLDGDVRIVFNAELQDILK